MKSSQCAVPEPSTVLNETLLPDNNESTIECENQPPAKKIKTAHSTKTSTTAKVLAEEINIQKEMCQAMKDQQQSSKKIYRAIDRLYDLKKEELVEQKRHNLQMERLRLREVEDKIERNQRLLELEELKTKM